MFREEIPCSVYCNDCTRYFCAFSFDVTFFYGFLLKLFLNSKLLCHPQMIGSRFNSVELEMSLI